VVLGGRVGAGRGVEDFEAGRLVTDGRDVAAGLVSGLAAVETVDGNGTRLAGFAVAGVSKPVIRTPVPTPTAPSRTLAVAIGTTMNRINTRRILP
jgi:hypothetical protein